jgi:hypothetical protein
LLHNFRPSEKFNTWRNHQRYSDSTKNRNQISREDCRQQINMEAAYIQGTKTSQNHHQIIKLATRQKIKSSDWK